MKVVIKNEDGQYPTGCQGRPMLSPRIQRAFVYDYEEDKVEEQICLARERFGLNWTWEDVGDGKGLLCLPKTPYRRPRT